MNKKLLLPTAAIISAGLTLVTAQAAEVDAQMPVQITIENACEITVAPITLDFGTQGVLSANLDATSDFQVTCTTDAAYDIGLDGGATGDINARTMTDGADFVEYQLYQEADRTTVWGDVISTNTVTSLGTGVAQDFTVYGRVPPQTTPPAGTYDDAVTVTVTY